MNNTIPKPMTTPARYIPFSKIDIMEMLEQDGNLDPAQTGEFGKLAKLLAATFHYEFHQDVENLKQAYRPFNPDNPTRRTFTESQVQEASEKLVEALDLLLNKANYEALSREEIESAYKENAVVDVRVKIRHSDFEYVRFYARGLRMEEGHRKSWFGLRKKAITFPLYDRVAILVRFCEASHFKTKQIDDLPFQPGSVVIKLFRNVPKADLEILYPNSKVAMKIKDRLMIGIPALVGGLPIISKVVTALGVIFAVIAALLGYEGVAEEDQMKQAIASLSALAALGMFLFKQYSSYQGKRNKFHRELSHNLYFRNLANNESVFFQLTDSAEEEECKEALLAYYFLTTTTKPLTAQQLDECIEGWFRDTHDCSLDFECPDALAKLERFQLLEKKPDGTLSVVPMAEALKRLDTRWDAFFTY